MSPASWNFVRTFGVALLAITIYILPTFAWDQALFSTARLLPLTNASSSVAVGDFNADGQPDVIAIAHINGAKPPTVLTWALAGTGYAQTLSIGNSAPVRPHVADINGDGYADVAVVGDNALVIAAGSKTGLAVVAIHMDHPLLDVQLADVNHDGAPDAIMRGADQTLPDGSVAPGTTMVRLHAGNFSFDQPLKTGLPAKGAMVAADLNLDGHLDLAVSSATGLDVALGRGDGTFFAPALSQGAGDGSIVLAVDIDGDQLPDVVSVRREVILFSKGDGKGRFDRAVPLLTLTGNAVESLDAGDIDRDGDIDLLIGSFDGISRSTHVVESLGGGGFGDLELALPSAGAVQQARFVDFNGDRLLDIVAVQKGQAIVALGVPTLGEYQALVEQNDALAVLVDKLRAQVSQLTSDLKTSETLLANATSTIAVLKDTVKGLQLENLELEKDLGQATSDLSATLLALDKSQKEAADLAAQVASLSVQLLAAETQVRSLTAVILGAHPDKVAAQALYDDAARAVARAKLAAPGDKRIAQAESELQKALTAFDAGDYPRSVKESQDAYDIAQRILDKSDASTNTSSPKPTVGSAPKK